MIEFTFRLESQDFQVFTDVVGDNEYQLPGAFNPGDVVVDIGANIGCFALAALRRGAAHVWCYEPDPANFRILLKNMEQFGDRVEWLPLAVWLPGVDSVNLLQVGGYTAMPTCVFGKGLPVNAVSLNYILTRHLRGKPVRLLKLDCEGAEWPILHTLDEATLSTVEEIVMEVHWKLVQPSWLWNCTPEGLATLMAKHGFFLSKIKDAGTTNSTYRCMRKSRAG